MTTETVLLLMLLTGLACSLPSLAMWRSKGHWLTLKSAKQLEEELDARMDNMHKRILTLEADGAEKDKRIDGLQAQSDRQQGRIAVLERQNVGLVAFVKRLIAQLERNNLTPEVQAHDLSRFLSTTNGDSNG